MTPTMRVRMLWIFVALLIVLGGALFASSLLINTKVVKKQISKQISDWMGQPVTVRGDPVVTIFPYLTVKLKDLQVASNLGPDQPPLVSMQTMRAEMHWLPLLFGKFEVRRFNLIDPIFNLVRDKGGKTSWDFSGGTLFQNNGNDGKLTLSDISLGNFRISGGVAHLHDRAKGQNEQVNAIDLSFDWPNTAGAAEIDGHIDWRGQTISLSAQSDKPRELFDGGLSPMSLRVQAPLFDVKLDGSAATMSALQLEGDFAFQTASLRELLFWLGIPLEGGEKLGEVRIKARSNLVGASLSLSDLELAVDDNQLDGVLQFDFRRDRPLIQGTLASDDLNLGRYLDALGDYQALLDRNLLLNDIGSADLDVRLSANKLDLGFTELGRTAASLMTRNNQASVSISESFAYGGRFETSLDVRPDRSNTDLMISHLRAKANGISAGLLARQIFDEELVWGTALAELDSQGNGASLRQIMHSANGTLSVVLTDGGLKHFHLDNFKKALEAQNKTKQEDQVEVGAAFKGEARFDVLSIRGQLADRILDLDGVRLTSGNLALLGRAQVSLSDRTLDFPGTLALYRSADPTSHSTENPERELPFWLTGPLGDLSVKTPQPGDNVVPDDRDILVPGVPQDMTPEQSNDAPSRADESGTQQKYVPSDLTPAIGDGPVSPDGQIAPVPNPSSTDPDFLEPTPSDDAKDPAACEECKPTPAPQDLVPQEAIEALGEVTDRILEQGIDNEGALPSLRNGEALDLSTPFPWQ